MTVKWKRLFNKNNTFHFSYIGFCCFVWWFPEKTGLIFCTVTRFIAKSRLEGVKVHVSCTTGYASDSVSTSKESHVSCFKVAMETILAKQHQMSNVPICFLCYWRKKKYFNCPELRREEGESVLVLLSISSLFIYFDFIKKNSLSLDKASLDERPSVMS